jgi:hypothetical protein
MKSQVHISQGKLILDNRKRFEQDLKSLKDGLYELSIRAKNRRSTMQNAYLWGVVYKEIQLALIDLGNDLSTEDVHEFLKSKFNPVEIKGTETVDTIGGSTAGMNKEEFSTYIDKISKWAFDFLNIEIPLPNTELKLF